MVEEGATLGRLCPGLERKQLIPGSCTTYRAMARLLGSRDPIQAGEFDVPAGTGGAALLDLLQHGRPVQRLITVTEGMPAIIVSERLAARSYYGDPAVMRQLGYDAEAVVARATAARIAEGRP